MARRSATIKLRADRRAQGFRVIRGAARWSTSGRPLADQPTSLRLCRRAKAEETVNVDRQIRRLERLTEAVKPLLDPLTRIAEKAAKKAA